MKVYVVLAGEQHEGGRVKGVYSTLEKARAAALSRPAGFDGKWHDQGDNYFINGCDFVDVAEWDVE